MSGGPCVNPAAGAGNVNPQQAFGPVGSGMAMQNDPWGQYLVMQHLRQQQQQQVEGQMTVQQHMNPPLPPSPTISGAPTLSSHGQAGNQVNVGLNVDLVLQARHLLQQLNPRELQSVFQSVGDRHRGFVPDRLGQMPTEPNVPGFLPTDRNLHLPAPGAGVPQERVKEEVDIFAKSEKWLGIPPVPSHEAWKSREDEILGWSSYVQELVGWATLGSVEFGREIEQASRWPTPITWTSLTKSQQARAVRLFSILRTAFGSHGRISLLIQGFMEGLDILPISSSGDRFGNVSSYMGNGFELLRQLGSEYSLRNRSEGLSLRSALMARTFAGQGGSLSPVSDVIRQIELACAKFMRLIATLPDTESAGLGIMDSDQLTLLIRSLPADARMFVLHHSAGDTYLSYRGAARRFEQQQRLFTELHTGRKIFAVQPEVDRNLDEEQVLQVDPSETLCALSKGNKGVVVKCTRCGEKNHDVSQCTVDLSKVKCYKCQCVGHISLNCKKTSSKELKDAVPKQTPSYGSGSGSSGSHSKTSTGSPGRKGSGKGKSGGKKGKMFAIYEEETGAWWYSDVPSHGGENDCENPQGEGATNDEDVSVLVLNCVLNEPNTLDSKLSQPELVESLPLPCGSVSFFACEHACSDASSDDVVEHDDMSLCVFDCAASLTCEHACSDASSVDSVEHDDISLCAFDCAANLSCEHACSDASSVDVVEHDDEACVLLIVLRICLVSMLVLMLHQLTLLSMMT